MNKILLGVALLFATGISAQTYFEDDFSSGLNNWTLEDVDGDGNNWGIFDANGNDIATSASWSSGNALTPDNWMISSAIDLSSATGVTKFSWLAQAQDQQFPDENYSVYVGTTNNISDFLVNGEDFNEIIGFTDGEWLSRSIDVSSFHGQTIYVAFRHHDVSDEFRLNLDDVRVAQVPNNDLSLNNVNVDKRIIGDRTFTVKVKNTGLDAVTNFDVDFTFDGNTETKNVTGVNLDFGDVHTLSFTVNEVTAGTKSFSLEITTTDDIASNNSMSSSAEFFYPVPQYVSTDSHGNSFDLHERLENGQAIILDFMASWCGPCESSTPELSQLVENNDSGSGKVEALAISVEQTDNASVLNGLNWNGGFYEYPKFPYTAANNQQYVHYAGNHGFNEGGGIPFFVIICPNVDDPKMSDIAHFDVGYYNGMMDSYQSTIDQCPTATYTDVIEMSNEEIDFNVYPNPANSIVNVDFELQNQSEVTVEILNTVGQSVALNSLGKVTGLQSATLDVSSLTAGMYIVKVSTDNGEYTKRISVAK